MSAALAPSRAPSSSVTFEPRHGTPVLDERAVGIAVRLVADEDEPVRLLAAWRLPEPARALHLVGVDARSGEVLHRVLEPPPGSSAVALDVAGELAVTGDRTLGVFLWSGAHVSAMRSVRLGAPPARLGPVAFDGRDRGAEPGDLELVRRGERLAGAVFAPGRASAEPRPLTLLALAGHELSWWRAFVPADVARDEEWRFEMPRSPRATPSTPSSLGMNFASREVVHYLAVCEDLRSDVLEVTP